MRIKPLDQVLNKWKTRASGAGADYVNGIRNPKVPQAQAAINAQDSYAQGVQASIARGAYAKGLTLAGDEKWARKSIGTGAARYPQGITDAAPDYGKGVAPYLEALANITLPPKFPRGSPQNNARVNAVTEALRAKKLSM